MNHPLELDQHRANANCRAPGFTDTSIHVSTQPGVETARQRDRIQSSERASVLSCYSKTGIRTEITLFPEALLTISGRMGRVIVTLQVLIK